MWLQPQERGQSKGFQVVRYEALAPVFQWMVPKPAGRHPATAVSGNRFAIDVQKSVRIPFEDVGPRSSMDRTAVS